MSAAPPIRRDGRLRARIPGGARRGRNRRSTPRELRRHRRCPPGRSHPCTSSTSGHSSRPPRFTHPNQHLAEALQVRVPLFLGCDGCREVGRYPAVVVAETPGYDVGLELRGERAARAWLLLAVALHEEHPSRELAPLILDVRRTGSTPAHRTRRAATRTIRRPRPLASAPGSPRRTRPCPSATSVPTTR